VLLGGAVGTMERLVSGGEAVDVALLLIAAGGTLVAAFIASRIVLVTARHERASSLGGDGHEDASA